MSSFNTNKDKIQFNALDFGPPVENAGWYNHCTQAVGRLVQKYGNEFSTAEALFDRYVNQVADLWVSSDSDPSPRYDWSDVMKNQCEEFFRRDFGVEPILKSAVGQTPVLEKSEDVIILTRYRRRGEAALSMPFQDALQTSWNDDTHFQPIASNSPSIRFGKEDDFMISYLCFDIDTEGHLPAAADWLQDVKGKLGKHNKLCSYAAFYATKNGCRVIYQPENYLFKNEASSMRKRYNQRFLRAGITVDDTKDFSRMFRLPNVIRDGERFVPSIFEIHKDLTVPVEKEAPVSLTNFTEITEYRGEREVSVKVQKSLKGILSDILEVSDGGLMSENGNLFYIKEGKPSYILSSAELVAYLSQFCSVQLLEIQGLYKRADIIASLTQQLPEYSSIQAYPFEPAQERVFVLNKVNVRKEFHTLDKLLEFFNPASPEDRSLLKALFVSPMLMEIGGKPAFILEGPRGSGKTTLSNAVAQLYGTDNLEFTQQTLRRGSEELRKNLVSANGRQHRTILVDNASGCFPGLELAQLITARNFSCKRPYGRGVENRNNDLTWFITSNDASFDMDIVSRSVCVTIIRNQSDSSWQRRLESFVEKNREVILGEIIGLLRREQQFTIQPQSRFPVWEEKVLQNCCENEKQYLSVLELIEQHRNAKDTQTEMIEELERIIRDRFDRSNLNMDRRYFIPKSVVREVIKVVNSDLSDHRIYSTIKNGLLEEKFEFLENVPNSKDGRIRAGGPRGFLWVPKNALEVISEVSFINNMLQLVNPLR